MTLKISQTDITEDKTEGAGDTEAETYGPLERKKHIKKETARET